MYLYCRSKGELDMKKLEQELRKFILRQIDFYADLSVTAEQEHSRDHFRGCVDAYLEILKKIYEMKSKLEKENTENA